MVSSMICLIAMAICWTAVFVGIILNVLLIQLVVYHTPKQMQIYSKILLQTCITDIIWLIVVLLFHPYSFVTQTGASEVISGGLIDFRAFPTISGFGKVLCCMLCVFLVYVSIFGYVAQFIYRYLILAWDKHLSSLQYFFLLTTILLFPLAYCIMLMQCYSLPEDHAFLTDQSVAEMLGMNVSDKIPLIAHSEGGPLLTIAFYYILFVCTVAYLVMYTLGWLMHRMLRRRKKLGVTTAKSKNIDKMNSQIMRNLIIQATMPFLIYLSLLFLLSTMLFNIDISKWAWLPYFVVFYLIPQYLPSALNPLVSIAIIRYYRRPLVARMLRIAGVIRMIFLGFFSENTIHPTSSAEGQQPPDNIRWAVQTVVTNPNRMDQ